MFEVCCFHFVQKYYQVVVSNSSYHLPIQTIRSLGVLARYRVDIQMLVPRVQLWHKFDRA